MDTKVRERKNEVRTVPNLPTKLKLQRQIQQFESRRDEVWRSYAPVFRDVENKKDSILDDHSQQLQQKTEWDEILLIRWKLA